MTKINKILNIKIVSGRKRLFCNFSEKKEIYRNQALENSFNPKRSLILDRITKGIKGKKLSLDPNNIYQNFGSYNL